jgi:outer membrane translocation and assembly module TamA
VLTEALRFEFGKPVDLDEWALARKRLYDTNVFRLVDIQTVPVGDAVNGVEPVKAVVRVEEYPPWTFRYGFQLEGERQEQIENFTSTRNAGVVAELRTPNLFGRALTSGVFGMYERDQQDGTLFLATSRLFGWTARSSLYGFYSRGLLRNPDTSDVDFVTERQGISVDQRWKPKGFQIFYGYRFERNHTFDPEPGNDPFPLDIVANLAKLSSALLFDRRDDPINPRTGTFSSISFDQAAPFLGSDVNNRKLLMQQYLFVPLKGITLASRVQAGFAFGRDDLLPSDRFRAGGATSVRGYSEDSLGPRIAGEPSGGDRLLVLNQEARFPMYGWVKGVLFVDAGNIFAKHEDWNSMKVGYGVGLRFDTPFALLRVDVGFPRNPLDTAIRSTKWYFGFGHIF